MTRVAPPRPTLAVVAVALTLAGGPRSGAAAPPYAAIHLVDVTDASGIDFVHDNSPTTHKYLIETMGGGVALLDYDNDGWLDIFFTNGAPLSDPMAADRPPVKTARYADRLYRNNHDGTFTETGRAAGVDGVGRGRYGMGAAVGDFDNDGFPDLYVTAFDANTLYRNDGHGHFVDVTAKAGVAAGGWSVSAAFLDYDNDGWLDLFVTRYVEWGFGRDVYCGERRPGYREYCHPSAFPVTTNILYHNNHDGTFTDVSQTTGISASAGRALGVAVVDYDGDGWPDIYVANDAVPGFLFHNNGGRGFTETALAAGVAVNADGRPFAGMGVDFGDYDRDGRPDLFVTALSNETYALYHNDGKGVFSFVSQPTGIAEATAPYAGWGTRFADLDNDGWPDLFVAQGHVLDTIELTSDHLKYLQPPLLLRNLRGHFERVGADSNPFLAARWAGRGAAFGDLDNDGDIDIVVGTCGGPPHVLRNETAKGNNWLSIATIGDRSNRDGAGAVVTVVGDSGASQTFTVTTSSSYLSASDRRVHVGLGSDRVVQSVTVRWPSGITEVHRDVSPRQFITLRESASR